MNSTFNEDINFGTLNVTTMQQLFQGQRDSIKNWGLGHFKVTDMEAMFQQATSFNQEIGDWNTSKVTSMRAMFKEASVFNRPLANWDTAKVTDIGSLFEDARAFNQDIGAWLDQVTDMSHLFQQ